MPVTDRVYGLDAFLYPSEHKNRKSYLLTNSGCHAPKT
jgi:hypothetical protein